MNPTRANFYNFSNNRCPMEENKFIFTDIRKGDKIQITKTHDDGTIVVVSGVAHNLTVGSISQTWSTERNVQLASSIVLSDWTYEFELLERTEPKDHIVVKVLADGSIRMPMTEPVTLAEATEKKVYWDTDYSPRECNNNKIMKLVDVDV